jgi:hypothetical protein
MHIKRGLLVSAFITLACSKAVLAQTNNPDDLLGQDKFRAITTAVPFLLIVPDARTSGLGDAGTTLSPDANSIQYNTAKLAFADKPIAAGLSVSPWLRSIGVTDMYISLLSGYYKPTKQDAITVGFTYFNLGSLTFTTETGATVRDFNPQEFAVAAGYSRQLTQKFAVGVNAKWIYSNLTGGYSGTSQSTRPGQTAAVDISAYYHTDFAIGGNEAQYVFAASLNNFGPKISYTNATRRDFIPTILRIGNSVTYNLDPFQKITFMVDASKLAVPTPNPANRDTLTGLPSGTEKNLLNGFFSSFSDAPDGFKEELSEIMLGGGAEYWYDNLLALRGGYFNEAKNKGGRKYFTVGAGVRYQQFGFDVSYLVPSSGGSNNPLANQLRFSLVFNFNKPDTQAEESVTD